MRRPSAQKRRCRLMKTPIKSRRCLLLMGVWDKEAIGEKPVSPRTADDAGFGGHDGYIVFTDHDGKEGAKAAGDAVDGAFRPGRSV